MRPSRPIRTRRALGRWRRRPPACCSYGPGGVGSGRTGAAGPSRNGRRWLRRDRLGASAARRRCRRGAGRPRPTRRVWTRMWLLPVLVRCPRLTEAPLEYSDTVRPQNAMKAPAPGNRRQSHTSEDNVSARERLSPGRRTAGRSGRKRGDARGRGAARPPWHRALPRGPRPRPGKRPKVKPRARSSKWRARSQAWCLRSKPSRRGRPRRGATRTPASACGPLRGHRPCRPGRGWRRAPPPPRGRGPRIGVSSPARCKRASRLASRLSVLTLSPDFFGINDGATTSQRHLHGGKQSVQLVTVGPAS